MQFSSTQKIVKTLPNGDPFHVQVYLLKGSHHGPKVTILANVHGAEVQGNCALYKLLTYFAKNPLTKGQIKIIPMANPQGLNCKIGTASYGRFSPVSGHNYNREYIDLISLSREKGGFSLKEFCNKNLSNSDEIISQNFKDQLERTLNQYALFYKPYGGHENQINWFLQKETISSDYVIDLHTGPQACRYLYAPEYAQKSAINFLFPHMLIIPHEFDGALDEASFMPWISLKEEFKKLDKDYNPKFEAFTLELGSEEKIDFDQAEDDSNRILHFLDSKNLLERTPPNCSVPQTVSVPLKQFRSYHAPTGGLISLTLNVGDRFKKGDLLAKIFHFNISNLDLKEMEKDCFTSITAQADGILINHTPHSGVESSMVIIQVMEVLFRCHI